MDNNKIFWVIIGRFLWLLNINTFKSYFREEWLTQIQNHQAQSIPIDVVEKSKSWFEYIWNADFPERSAYRCRLCHKYWESFGLQSNHKPAVARVEGTWKRDKPENRRVIQEHPKSVGHLKVIEILEQRSIKRWRRFSLVFFFGLHLFLMRNSYPYLQITQRLWRNTTWRRGKEWRSLESYRDDDENSIFRS